MIELNGRKTEWEEGLTIEKLLKKQNYTYPMIVVTVNDKKIDRAQWAEYVIPKDARVLAHHLIAGG